MKKYLLFACLFCMAMPVLSQSDDTALNKRMAAYLAHTKALEIKELMEYIHPSLFAITSKEQFIEIFKNTFENKEMVIRLDSMAINKVSAPFNAQNKEYRKIDYSMVMYLRFADKTLLENEEMVKVVKQGMEQAFPKGKVIFDELDKSFMIRVNNEMVAIREGAAAPWMFLGVERSQSALVNQLFPAAVIRHFSLL